MKWSQFAEEAAELAEIGEQCLDRLGVVLLGTLRKNGYPRISAVEPLFANGELYLGMMWKSVKALDLLRDPRFTVHSPITDRNGREGEFKLHGTVRDVDDPGERQIYATALNDKIGWVPPEPYHLFALRLEGAAYRRFSYTLVSAMVWRPGEGTERSEEKVPAPSDGETLGEPDVD